MELHAIAESLDQLTVELRALRNHARMPFAHRAVGSEAYLVGWAQGHAEAQLDVATMALVSARAWIAGQAKELDRHVPGEGPGGKVVRIRD